jgi:transglutaminase-like putative cysteine protease
VGAAPERIMSSLVMMEAVRSVGMAARFVSGYLYEENSMGARGVMVGAFVGVPGDFLSSRVTVEVTAE